MQITKYALAVLFALSASVSSAQTTLTVAAFPAVDKIVKSAIPAWRKHHPDVDIKVISRAYADHHNAMVTSLATGTSLPDIMAVELGFLGRFAEGRRLEDLSKPPFDGAKYTSEFVPFSIPQATNSQGELSALPADIGPGTLFYRADLLKRAGVSEKELTKSWESYIEAGKKIKEATGSFLLASTNDLMSIIIRSNLKDGEGIYFDKDKNVLVDSPRFVKAFKLAKAVRDAGLDAEIGAWSNEWSEGFKRGAIATQMMGAWLGGHLQSWLAPNTRGLWRVANLPDGAYASWGGTFYAIPKNGANRDLAWAFVKFMILDKQQQLAAFKQEDAFPALVAAHEDPFYDEPVEFFGGQKARILWRDAVLRIPAISVGKHDAVAGEVISTELDNVLFDGKDIKAALADAKALIKRRARR
jgi:multiple sugar transport system substrate-binding protein